jgi:hypothetical protein
MKKNKLSIREKSLVSNFLNSVLRRLKLFILFFIPKKYKEFVKEFVEECELGQPYCIIVDNIGDEILENVDLFGSYEYLGKNCFDLDGNMQLGSIKIRPPKFYNISYREMLYQFMNQPFSVGLTIIESTTPNQVLNIIKVFTKDANGNQAQKTLVPTINPFEKEINYIEMNYVYGIDGFTKLIISKLLAKTKVKIYLYPILNNSELNNSESKKTKFQKFVEWLKK